MLASGLGQNGRGIMHTVTSFVSGLFIFTSSQQHDFPVFFVFQVFYRSLVLNTFLYPSHTLSLSLAG